MASPFTLDDLVQPLTFNECKARIYDVLGALGVRTTGWGEGAVVRSMVAAVAVLMVALSFLLVEFAKSGFLDLSTGGWLTLLAHYVYGVDRIESGFAIGSVTISNSSVNTYDFDPGDLIAVNTSTGKTFQNQDAISLGPGDSDSFTFIAVESGAASTSVATDIDNFETPLLGLTCSNPTAIVGVDSEKDSALRSRCRDKLGSLSPNGPPDAYSYIAKSATRSDGSSIGVNRVRSTKDGFGNLTVYVANATGALESGDLSLVDEALQVSATPLGINLTTLNATPVTLDVVYSIWLYNRSGLISSQIQTAIENRLIAYISSQPIGGNVIGVGPGKIFASALEALIGSATSDQGAPLDIFKVVVSFPVGDFSLTLNQVAVPGGVTAVAITQIQDPGLV